MANDYYDFNPSATTWALMLTGVVLFTVGLCVLLIWAIARAEASSVAIRAADAERDAWQGRPAARRPRPRDGAALLRPPRRRGPRS